MLRKQFLLDRRALERFLIEAEILSAVRHPQVINCYGLGRTPANGYFIVLDWRARGDLQRQEIRRPLSPEQLSAWMLDAAGGVAALHTAGIVHGDLKPSNLLVADDKSLQLTDFGFAWRMAQGEHSLGGTLGYLAPEVLHSTSTPLSPAVDIYGLGTVLHWLLHGEPPSNPYTAGKRPDEAPPRIFEIMLRCLAKDPSARYASVTELMRDLQVFAAT